MLMHVMGDRLQQCGQHQGVVMFGGGGGGGGVQCVAVVGVCVGGVMVLEMVMVMVGQMRCG